jgi:hypothetical protein
MLSDCILCVHVMLPSDALLLVNVERISPFPFSLSAPLCSSLLSALSLSAPLNYWGIVNKPLLFRHTTHSLTLPPMYWLVRVISPEEDLLEVITTETEGLGVDFVLENPVAPNTPQHSPFSSSSSSLSSSSSSSLSSASSSSSSPIPSESTQCTRDVHPSHALEPATVASLLAARGVWVTSRVNAELDAPLTEVFRLKSLTLSFLDEQTWVTAPTQLGRYQRMAVVVCVCVE